jgi:hypothetical protein
VIRDIAVSARTTRAKKEAYDDHPDHEDRRNPTLPAPSREMRLVMVPVRVTRGVVRLYVLLAERMGILRVR